jgi:hypothetical protein
MHWTGSQAGSWGGDIIACPECGAPAEIRDKNATPCRTWVAINSGGKVYVTEAEEVLVIVELLCAAGHRFVGPEEMLERTNELTGWEQRIA